jgi:hypothetical protein
MCRWEYLQTVLAHVHPDVLASFQHLGQEGTWPSCQSYVELDVGGEERLDYAEYTNSAFPP